MYLLCIIFSSFVCTNGPKILRSAQKRSRESKEKVVRHRCDGTLNWIFLQTFLLKTFIGTFFLPISLRTSTFLDINERLASTFLLLLPSFCCLDNRTYKSDILSHTFPKSTSIFQGWSPLILVENMKSSHKINCKSEWSKKGQQTIY